MTRMGVPNLGGTGTQAARARWCCRCSAATRPCQPVLLIRTMAGNPAAPDACFAAGLLADDSGKRGGGGGRGLDY